MGILLWFLKGVNTIKQGRAQTSEDNASQTKADESSSTLLRAVKSDPDRAFF